jgi:ubiquitin C-terminal hydrolase
MKPLDQAMMMSEDEEEESAAKTANDQEMQEEEPKENFEYKLVGVVIHMGTADAGHYLSYINTNRGTQDTDKPEWLLTDKDKWLEFNDSLIRDYRFANLEQDCFGGMAQGVSGGN